MDKFGESGDNNTHDPSNNSGGGRLSSANITPSHHFQQQHSQQQQQQQYMASHATMMAMANMYQHLPHAMMAADHYIPQHPYHQQSAAAAASNFWGAQMLNPAAAAAVMGGSSNSNNHSSHIPSKSSTFNIASSTVSTSPSLPHMSQSSPKISSNTISSVFSSNNPSQVSSQYQVQKKEKSPSDYPSSSSPLTDVSFLKKEITTESPSEEISNTSEIKLSYDKPSLPAVEDFTASTISSLPKKDRLATCLICHGLISLDLEPWRDLENDFTSTNFICLTDLIIQVLKDVKKTLNLKKSTFVCMSCFTLLDRVDELQEQLKVNLCLFYC